MAKEKKVQLLAGKWAINGPFLKGAEVNDVILDTRSKPIMYACANCRSIRSAFPFCKAKTVLL